MAQPASHEALSRGGGEGGLVVDVGGFEGPLDLLLTLAREQKVDLARISILTLVEQYLAFVARARAGRLDIAAEYLVMAAWLAYLKSRLLLPAPPGSEDEPSAEEMAAALAFQLRRLEAMRKVGQALLDGERLFRDRWPRGEPEDMEGLARPAWDLSFRDLLAAYGDVVARRSVKTLDIEAPDLYSVDVALARLSRMLGRMPSWATLASFLPEGLSGLLLRSAVSAHFVATLELCRQGMVEIRQDGQFAPLMMRARGRG